MQKIRFSLFIHSQTKSFDVHTPLPPPLPPFLSRKYQIAPLTPQTPDLPPTPPSEEVVA